MTAISEMKAAVLVAPDSRLLDCPASRRHRGRQARRRAIAHLKSLSR